MPLFIEGVPVDTLLDDIHTATCNQAAEKGVRVHVEVIAWEELVAAADARRLKLVLTNLVDDAIASAPGGTVLIQAYPCPDDVHLTIEVRDTRDYGVRPCNPECLDMLSTTVRTMAGELTTAPCPEGGRSVYCNLPQWISGPADHAFAA